MLQIVTNKIRKKLDLCQVFFVYYNMIKKGKNMNYETYVPCCTNECKCPPTNIDIPSVGSWVDCNGMVFASHNDSVNTGHDPDSPVHIMDCVDEWWECMTKDECFKVLEFLETNGVIDMGFFPEGKDTKWASNVYHISGDGMEVV